jgi:hypothetical protein
MKKNLDWPVRNFSTGPDRTGPDRKFTVAGYNSVESLGNI